MSVHVAPLMLHVRGYRAGVDVDRPLSEMSEPYLYHIVVLVNDLGIARLEGLDGRMSHSDIRELKSKLRLYGIRRIQWRHHGNEKNINL